LLLAVLAVTGACVSSGPPTAHPTSGGGQVQNLESRARAAVQSGDLSSAAELYAQLAASVGVPKRIDYLIESAALSVERGDTQLARRRLPSICSQRCSRRPAIPCCATPPPCGAKRSSSSVGRRTPYAQ